MSKFRPVKTTNDYIEMVNMDTGAIRRIPLATDKQYAYLQSLRREAGKEPLKNKPTVFAAKKAIDKLLEKTRQKKLF